MLGPVRPDVSKSELLRVSVEQRNATLLALRHRLFGDEMPASVRCPECGERLEFSLDAAGMLEGCVQDAGPDVHRVEVGGREVAFRSPTSEDLIDAGPARGDAPLDLTLSRCVVAGGVDSEVLDAVGAALAERDPLFDLAIGLECVDCGHPWESPFDIVEFLFAEIGSEADRLLADVVLLARAYGWSETEILSLDPKRRAYYLEAIP